MKYPDDDYQSNEISKAFNINGNYALHLLRIALRSCDDSYIARDGMRRRDYLVKRFGTDRCDIAESNEPLPYNVKPVSMEEMECADQYWDD